MTQALRAFEQKGRRMADQQFTSALDASSEVELTVTGRTSGREIAITVWFVRERDTLYLVPVNGSDSDWYKNLLKHPTIRLSAGNADLSTRATPITKPAKVGQILDKFRAKYGADDVAAYYPRHDVAAEIPLA
jgi:deazaflavin-dependent oxidoreductase (nitroreductase family)